MNKIVRLKTTKSTNKEAYKHALDKAEAWTVVIAENQTQGRGRLGKDWISVGGKGLFCSVILRPEVDIEELAKSTLIVGLAAAEAVEEVCKGIDVGLKWPNDLYVSGKKIGGILVESSPLNEQAAIPFLIAGIGINVDVEFEDIPKDLREKATSILIETGVNVEKEKLLMKLCYSIKAKIEQFETQGSFGLLNEWKKRDILCGKQVNMVGKDGLLISGTALGIDEAGEFLLCDENNEIHQVLSGDVRLAKKGCCN